MEVNFQITKQHINLQKCKRNYIKSLTEPNPNSHNNNSFLPYLNNNVLSRVKCKVKGVSLIYI